MREATLLFETLRLRPGTEAAALASGWRAASETGLAALADYEMGHTWMLRRLRESGAAETAPPGLVQALVRHVREVEARNMLVDAEAATVVGHLGRIGVPHVLIKGVARRAATGRWPYANARATNDVDIILPAADAQRAWEALVSAGYHRYSEATSPHHLPGLIGALRVGVELHTSLAHALEPAEAWRRAITGAHAIQWQGAESRVPCATEMLWHGLSHGFQINDLIPWRLRYFLDAAAILAADDTIDWAMVKGRLADGEARHADTARRWLGAAAQLAGVGLPADVAAGLPAFDVHRALSWRLGVLARHQDAGLGGRMLEEATRIELGMEVTPTAGGTPFKQARRWLAGRAARLSYRVWRAMLQRS